MDVDRYRASKLHLHNKTVANHLTLLGGVLNLACDLGWMVKAPKINKPKVRLISQDYRYLRSQDEIRRLLAAAALEEDEQTEVLYATMLGFRYLLALDGKRVFGLDDLGKESLWRPAHIRWTHGKTGAEYTLGFAWFPGAQGDGFQVTWTPKELEIPASCPGSR